MSEFSYARVDCKGWSGLIHQGIQTEEVFKLFSEQRGIREDPGSIQKVKENRKVRVWRSWLTFNGHPCEIYIKQFLLHSFFALIKYDLGKSRARSAFHASLMLGRCGISAPLPLAVAEKKKGPVTQSSIMITQAIQGSEQLDRKLEHISGEYFIESLRNRRQLIREFGKAVGQMHDQGILHGDLRLRNVLVQQDGENYFFWFIDNERTKRFAILSPRQVRKNLVQVNKWKAATNTDRLRFLKAYVRERGWSETDVKKMSSKVARRIWWRDIIDWIRKPLKRYKPTLGS